MSSPVKASCHCGAIRLSIDVAPEEVVECNCSICRRYGAVWAYYSRKQVHFTPATPQTDTYVWGERSIAFHRCQACRCLTHWSALDPDHERMGINARLLAPEVMGAARHRLLDGADTWTFLGE